MPVIKSILNSSFFRLVDNWIRSSYVSLSVCCISLASSDIRFGISLLCRVLNISDATSWFVSSDLKNFVTSSDKSIELSPFPTLETKILVIWLSFPRSFWRVSNSKITVGKVSPPATPSDFRISDTMYSVGPVEVKILNLSPASIFISLLASEFT